MCKHLSVAKELLSTVVPGLGSLDLTILSGAYVFELLNLLLLLDVLLTKVVDNALEVSDRSLVGLI